MNSNIPSVIHLFNFFLKFKNLNYYFSKDALCGEVESEAQRLLDLLVLPPRDAVGRELQGYDHRRERQHVQFLLRRVQDGQGRLQHAWSMERLRLRRIIEISTCERDSQQVSFN